MNVNYLNNIIDLYLKNEKDGKKTKMSLTKQDDIMRFSFSMENKINDKTIVSLPLDIAWANLKEIIKKYKGNLISIEDNYDSDNKDDYCYYVKFNNGRVITFNHFSLIEINNIRNMIYNININQNEIRIFEKKEENLPIYHYHKPSLLPNYGFSSYKLLLVSIISITITLCLSLTIFSLFVK